MRLSKEMDIMTNEQLVARIKAGEDIAENMQQLYEQTRHFIHSIAWKYRDSGELDDLEQEGYLALYPAIDGYNLDHGVKFLTYAEYYISQRMRRYLQKNGGSLRISAHQDEKVKRYKRFSNMFQIEHGRMPADSEAAASLGMTLEQVKDIQKSACMTVLVSLDSPVTGSDGGNDTVMGDMIASDGDMEGDTVDRLDHERLYSVLWDCVDRLPENQTEVVRKRYQTGLTLAEIGRELGTTPEAVRQMHVKALRELRKSKYSDRLRPFLPEADRIYSMALCGNGAERFNQTWTSSTERVAFKMMDWEEQRRERLELVEQMRGTKTMP